MSIAGNDLAEIAFTSSASNMDASFPDPTEDMAKRLTVNVPPAKRAKLFESVAGFHHKRFLERQEGQRYLLKARGIRNIGLFRDYRIGYSDGALSDALPQDAQSVAEFRALGVVNGRRQEPLEGCVVFRLTDADGAVVNLYGRRIEGADKHALLVEDRGIWNPQAVKRAPRLLITGSIIDALTLIDRGLADVLPCFGKELNEDQVALLRRSNVKTVTLCLRAGDARTSRLEKQFVELGIAVQAAALPNGHDVNSFLLKNEIGAFQALLPREKASASTASANYQRTPYGFVFTHESRRYEVKGIDRQATQLKAVLKAIGERGKGHWLETIDLYSARSRERYATECASMYGVDTPAIKADLGQIAEHAEAWKAEDDTAKPAIAVSSEQDRAAALAWLRNPKLLEQIEADLTALGVAGESLNKRVCFLAATSRKLESPLSLLVQSRSAAGKSTLQNAVLALVPDEDKFIYTRMTDQALFYQDPEGLKHKLVAMEEAEGLGGAAYSLRILQSQKQLAIATTSKDSVTGKMKTEQYVVQGPVAVLVTTTSAALDEETASRFLTVTIDESTTMTERILELQREAATMEGFVAKLNREALIRLHHAAQRLLEPVTVFIPQAKKLSYPVTALRARRDHDKYLNLIRAITFLHQKQRPIQEFAHGERVIRYINATREDIRAANAIAQVVFAQSVSELSAPARNLLTLIHRLVKERCAEGGVAAREFVFTRRTVREATGWSETQVRKHMEELQELEYVTARAGAQGKEYFYELPAQEPELSPTLKLIDPDQLPEAA